MIHYADTMIFRIFINRVFLIAVIFINYRDKYPREPIKEENLFESKQQSLINVFHYISSILDSDGEPDQIIGDSDFRPLFSGEIFM